MSINLSTLDNANRLLFAIALKPMQGSRFQPTGFPGLGAAAFQTPNGQSLLVESAQSMANRLELTVWDEAKQDLKAELAGLSHVRVMRNGAFLTDSILEAHRLNSPYLIENSDTTFFEKLKVDLGIKKDTKDAHVGNIDRTKLVTTLLKYDIGSLLHGVFLAKPTLQGGRLRLARALSAFIEADGVRVAASGGVKNDHVFPDKKEGDSKNHFGNIPFARDEYTAENITLFVSLDLGQIRGYGFESKVTDLLILLALYKLRVLLSDSLRLRTACDLTLVNEDVVATSPNNFALPSIKDLEATLTPAIAKCAAAMVVELIKFNDVMKKAKDEAKAKKNDDAPDSDEPEVDDAGEAE